MSELSEKERAVLNKIKELGTKSIMLALEHLDQSELGCLGKLTQKGYVEIYRDYVQRKKFVRLRDY